MTDWNARALELAKFVNEMRPTSLEPLAAILSGDDMSKLRALDASGWFNHDSGRIVCPRFCA